MIQSRRFDLHDKAHMNAARWLGFALVSAALVALPIAIWVSAWWGFVSGGAGVAGLVLLGVAFAGRHG
jgi:hypothetical protein